MLEAIVTLLAEDAQPSPKDTPTPIVQKQPAKPKPKANVESVIVKARKISKPFAQTLFKQMDIYTNPTAKADVMLAVADLQFATSNNNSADIILRGGSARLSREYYNDVPFYEVVRGASQLQTSRGFSIFNTSTIDSVETYASAPPSYFANTAGGVVRILPQETGNDGGELQINLTKATLTLGKANIDKNGSYLQIYSDLSNLSPLSGVNADIGNRVKTSKGADLGLSSLFIIDDKTQLRTLNIFDYEDAKYFNSLFDSRDLLNLHRNRNYNVVSLERVIANGRLKLDYAKTLTNQSAGFDGNLYFNNNNYEYYEASFASKFAKIPVNYRIGTNREVFDLNSRAQITLPSSTTIFPNANQNMHYNSLYGFANYSPTKRLSLSLGARSYFDDDFNLDPTLQFSASYKDKSLRHNFIFALGQYGAVVLPLQSAFEALGKAKSNQISADYKYTNGSTKFGFGIYNKRENILNKTTNINGLDASFSFAPNERTEISGNLARTLPHFYEGANKYNGENRVDYLVKLKAKFALSKGDSLNFNYTAMSGAYYSLPISTTVNDIGQIKPIYGAQNDKQLASYASLDVNYISRLRFWKSANQPIYYLNVNNILNKNNQANIEFSDDFSQNKIRNYIKRTFVVGILFSF